MADSSSLAPVRYEEPTELPRFSSCTPEDWLGWKSTFHIVVKTNGWDDRMARLHLAVSMEGKAKLRTMHIPVLDDPVVPGDFNQLVAAYEAALVPPSGSSLAWLDFHHARQGPREHIRDWHWRIRFRFCRARPDLSDKHVEESEELMIHFIEGLRDDYVREVVWRKRPQSYQNALIEAIMIANE